MIGNGIWDLGLGEVVSRRRESRFEWEAAKDRDDGSSPLYSTRYVGTCLSHAGP